MVTVARVDIGGGAGAGGGLPAVAGQPVAGVSSRSSSRAAAAHVPGNDAFAGGGGCGALEAGAARARLSHHAS